MGELNEDVLEELEMMYSDVDAEILRKAATLFDNTDDATEYVMKALEAPDTNPKPVVDPMAGERKLKAALPHLGDDQIRGLLAAFNQDADEAVGVATNEKDLIDVMLEKGWSIEEARKSAAEKKAREAKEGASAEGPVDWSKQPLDVEELAKRLVFGPAAFGPLKKRSVSNDGGGPNLQSQVKDIILATIPGASKMMNTRGDACVTQTITTCYGEGLFTLGGPGSTVNSQVVPAIRYIFSEMNKLSATDSKRVLYINNLTQAFTDCQAVQAREILRLYADLTSQSMTFDDQLKYSLIPEKERAIHIYITHTHNGCDLDHTQVQPYQQRPHLISGYTALVGEGFGLDEASIVAAQNDRFVDAAKKEIGTNNVENLITALRSDMDVKEWLKTLLADINNQSDGVDRLIDRSVIFKWCEQNMTGPERIFYDEDRAGEFAHQEPQKPTDANKYQPFLSWRILVEILVAMGMVKFSAAWSLFSG